MKVTINSGARFTNQTAVGLDLEIPAEAQKLEASNRADFGALQRLPLQSQASWQLEGVQSGERTVYVRYRTASGATGPVATASIIYDADPPTGRVTIAANAGWALLLNVQAWDALSGVAAMALGVSADGLTWQPYATTVKYVMPAGYQGAGNPVVFFRFRDQAGNESPVSRSDAPTAAAQRSFVPLATGR
jgi:hypothetical protein